MQHSQKEGEEEKGKWMNEDGHIMMRKQETPLLMMKTIDVHRRLSNSWNIEQHNLKKSQKKSHDY